MVSLLLVLVMLLGAAAHGGAGSTGRRRQRDGGRSVPDRDGAGAGRFPRRGKRLGEKEHVQALREAHGEYRPGQRSLDANRKNDQYI